MVSISHWGMFPALIYKRVYLNEIRDPSDWRYHCAYVPVEFGLNDANG